MSTLIPPFRFAHIEEDLFRSGYPTGWNLRHLKRLRLKSIVSVIPSKPTEELTQFCSLQGIQNVHIKVEKYKEKNPLTHQVVAQALELMVNPKNLPLLIHCMNGVEVTGLIVMCLRKLQMIALPYSMVEFTRFVKEGMVTLEETEFVENFRSEIAVPETIPRWLWRGDVTFAPNHPSIRVKSVTKTEPKRELDRKVVRMMIAEKGSTSEATPERDLSLAIKALALEMGK